MSFVVITVIRWYQALTRGVGANPFWFSYSGCRSWPTCSDYAIQAIEQDGVIRGGVKAIIRVTHCHA
jgi:putative membrane protein insertion efficiency factor